jgi:hypothetical protein
MNVQLDDASPWLSRIATIFNGFCVLSIPNAASHMPKAYILD